MLQSKFYTIISYVLSNEGCILVYCLTVSHRNGIRRCIKHIQIIYTVTYSIALFYWQIIILTEISEAGIEFAIMVYWICSVIRRWRQQSMLHSKTKKLSWK